MTDEEYQPTDGYPPSPAVIAAEIAVAGAAIASGKHADLVGEVLDPADCYQPRHELVIRAALALAEAGKPVTPVTVGKQLTETGDLPRIGGLPYIHTLQAYAATGESNLRYEAGLVTIDAGRRRMHSAGVRITAIAANPAYDPETDLELVTDTIDNAVAGVRSSEVPTIIGSDLAEALDELEAGEDNDTVPTGWTDVDALLSLRPGQLVTIGARPGVGKSTAVVGLASHAAIERGLPVLYASLEMSRREVQHRLLACQARVDLDHIQRRALTEKDWQRISQSGAVERIQAAPLIVDDTPHTGLAHLRARLRWMARTKPAKLVIVDYLQLMAAPKANNREQEVAGLSRGLKLLAREYGVPVVICAQLNRASEQRVDKKPHLADLRESGAVEQDSDVVMFLHRPEVHNSEDRPNQVDVIVAKQRQGRTGTVTLTWLGHYSQMADMALTWSPTDALRVVQ